MNIVTQFPINLNLNIANPQTEAARKDALSRDAITQATAAEQQAAETGVGSDRERALKQSQQPVTYEFNKQELAKAQQEAKSDLDSSESERDATEDQENRGKQFSENQENNQAEQQEQAQIEQLKERDKEVKAHEQAHANIGGQYAGTPSYEYQRGPDGQSYAVGGEVKIDVSTVAGDPEATIRKMEQVQRAALAPAEPSNADRSVAAEAATKAQEARVDLQQEKQADLQAAKHAVNETQAKAEVFNSEISPTQANEKSSSSEVEAVKQTIQQEYQYEAPKTLSAQASLKSDTAKVDEFTQSIAERDQVINARALKIQRFYHTNSTPHQTEFTRYA
ncbi:putative metalloprotease CJM1_0395 family protein [Catenovulum maritimum]|uniref:putative metalloprotease CJM1_0395 family protein n=1 Tax=Catenovulum maritimum TaxID=1513271 RepID=UPI00069D70E2|nr:putative metalloprotease CJM1_0395 family protein [Catenovulum maritimum]